MKTNDNEVMGIIAIASVMVIALITLACVETRFRHEHNQPIVNDTIIDSSFVEADSLQKRINPYDLAMAFAKVESGNDPSARNGNCVGLLQISPICVREVNRLLGYETFTLADREDQFASIAMFVVIMDAKNPSYDIKTACHVWNPTAGEWYYERVLKSFNELNNQN